jgi:hypothetical protein
VQTEKAGFRPDLNLLRIGAQTNTTVPMCPEGRGNDRKWANPGTRIIVKLLKTQIQL